MNSRIAGHILLTAMLACGAAAFAGEQPVIVNTGEATVFTLPGQVEFQFVRHFTGDTLQAAVEACSTFLNAAPQAIRGSELQPIEVYTSPPLITAPAQRQARGIITVRFSMAVFNTAKTGAAQFAGLCDKLAVMAETMQSTLAAPRFVAADPDTVEASAVARATENAYYAAEAVAHAVKTNIFAVDNAEILAIEWEQQPDLQRGDTLQIACRAKVRVTYALAPQ